MVRIISLVAILASCISSVLALANGIYTISNGVDYWTETLEDVIYLTTATGSDNQEWNVTTTSGKTTIENVYYENYAGTLVNLPGDPLLGGSAHYLWLLEGTNPYEIQPAATTLVQLYAGPGPITNPTIVALELDPTEWKFTRVT